MFSNPSLFARVNGVYRFAFEQDVPAVLLLEPGDDTQGRCFARVRGADDAEKLPAFHGEADLFEGPDLSEALAYPSQFDCRH
jgi:hypothetical protein